MARTPKSGEPRKRENPEKTFCNSQFKPFTAKTDNQRKYFSALNNFDIVFGIGPAGTGKTACSVAHCCQELYFGRIDKIIVTRPALESCGENLGFLPGEIEDKFSVYLTPIREIAEEVLGKSHYEMFVKSGKIIAAPLGYCRGRTFNDSFIILDEAQNTSPEQMKMLLTRMGRNAKVFVNGDSQQSDYSRGTNGLDDAVDRLSWHPRIKVVEFFNADIVRNGLISEILESYQS